MSTNQSATIGQRIWNYCNVLRDDGVSYGDYLEQLVYLLFLKMDDENRQAGDPSTIPNDLAWRTLVDKSGDELEAHYNRVLEELSRQRGLIGAIFRKSENRLREPAKLRRLIHLIDSETWMLVDVDTKAAIYEDLLERNARDTKSGAGQYFTPRPLIQALVDVMQPKPDTTICDPACGTGGFLFTAYDYIKQRYGHALTREQWRFLAHDALHGWEIVNDAARLCVMNLYLRGIGHDSLTSPIHVDDSLASDPGQRFDMVLTNPPFGRKSSTTFVTEEGELKREAEVIVRDDFWASTTNKQLNFVQHIKTITKVGGKVAVVVPDNVLFEGGVGETVRRKLLQECDVHTLLRLPTGIFYAQGVKANVLFFDRLTGGEQAKTKELWIYDLRTNMHFTLKQNPLTRADLDDFVACYHPDNRHERVETWSEDNPTGRWRRYPYDQLAARDKLNLDIFWLRDESLEDTANLPAPDIIAAEIVEDLRAALEQFEEIYAELGAGEE